MQNKAVVVIVKVNAGKFQVGKKTSKLQKL